MSPDASEDRLILGKEPDRGTTLYRQGSPEAIVEEFSREAGRDPVLATLQISPGLPDSESVRESMKEVDLLGKPSREFYAWILDLPDALSNGREGEVLVWVRVYDDESIKVGGFSSEGAALAQKLYENFSERTVPFESASIGEQSRSPLSNPWIKVGAGVGVVGLAYVLVSTAFKGDPSVNVISPEIPEHRLNYSAELAFLQRFDASVRGIEAKVKSGITDFRGQPTGLRAGDILFLEESVQSSDLRAVKAAVPIYARLAVLGYQTGGSALTSNPDVTNALYSDSVIGAIEHLEKAKNKTQDEATRTIIEKAIMDISESKERSRIGG